MESIYVLLLEENKYYIGHVYAKSQEDIEWRIMEHVWKLETCAEWTRRYAVRQVVGVFPGTLIDEENLTLLYMQKYGRENCRGGTHCQLILPPPPPDESSIAKTISALSACYHCHQQGHYSNQCPLKCCALCGSMTHQAKECLQATVKCYKCGNMGHVQKDCPDSERKCFHCKQAGHYEKSCPNRTAEYGSTVRLSKPQGNCYRCGYPGHWANQCTFTAGLTTRRVNTQ